MKKRVLHNKRINFRKSIVSFLCASVLSSFVSPYQVLATEVPIENQNVIEELESIDEVPVDDNLDQIKDEEIEVIEEATKESTKEATVEPKIETPVEVQEDLTEPIEVPKSETTPIIEEEVSEEVPSVSLEENRQNAWDTFISGTQNSSMMMMRTISPTESFISQVGPQAKKVAASNGLYASVMIAQAALESNWGRSTLALPPNYNLFGIKGSYNGESVAMSTLEYSTSKGWYTIIANFRKYPSYSESLQDNANLLRNGVSYNRGIYSGTWLENTINYLQSTDHLEGIYATDPSYDTKLNSIIEQYNLTQYDTYDSVTSSNKNTYSAKLTTVAIYSRPDGMYNAQTVTDSGLSISSEVIIKQEMRTQSGVFAKIYNSDDKYIGWVNKEYLRIYDTNLGSKSKNYFNLVKSSITGIYTKPYNLEGSQKISDGSSYVGKYIQIQQEMTTQSGVYGKAYLNGIYIGWINTNDLMYDVSLSSKPVSYTADISNSVTGIYTKPFAIEGSVLVSNFSNYAGKQVIIKQEMQTQSGTYAKLYYNNTYIGWINKKELSIYDTNLGSKSKDYAAVLSEKVINIYTKPYNMKDSQLISNVSSYASKDVQITQEMKTQSGTYAKINYNNNFIGWVKTSDLSFDTNLDSTQKNYSATVKDTYNGIFTKPKFFEGAISIDSPSTYVNKRVQVKQLMNTSHGNYAKIYSGDNFVGWILESDLK